MSECEHIYGYETCYDTGGKLIIFDKEFVEWADVKFNYCPLCGEKLGGDDGEGAT